MTVQDLKAKLDTFAVPEHMYSLLKGGLPNERLCLIKTDDGWEIYYSERGEKNGIKSFDSEDAACSYFYQKMLKQKFLHGIKITGTRSYINVSIDDRSMRIQGEMIKGGFIAFKDSIKNWILPVEKPIDEYEKKAIIYAIEEHSANSHMVIKFE